MRSATSSAVSSLSSTALIGGPVLQARVVAYRLRAREAIVAGRLRVHARRRGDLHLLPLAVADDEAHARRQTPNLVGVDAQLVLGTRRADVGGETAFVLQAPLGRHPGAGRLDDRLGLRHGVQDDRVGGVEDPRGCLGSAHPVVALWCEDDGGTIRPDDLDHPGDAFAVGDRGELVDDQQDLAAVGVAAGEVLLEVLDE